MHPIFREEDMLYQYLELSPFEPMKQDKTDKFSAKIHINIK